MFLNIFVVAFDGPDATLYERILTTAWNDRGWRVREGGCYLLRHTLDQMIDGLFQGKVSIPPVRPNFCKLTSGKLSKYNYSDELWSIKTSTTANPTG